MVEDPLVRVAKSCLTSIQDAGRLDKAVVGIRMRLMRRADKCSHRVVEHFFQIFGDNKDF